MTDATDFLRERERLSWKDYLQSGSIEDLLTWRRALQNLNDELSARVDAHIERHLEARRSRAVQMSGPEGKERKPC